jgi:hypothetical protein
VVRECANEFNRVDPLPMQMARIEVETEFLAIAKGFERPFGGVNVKGDFRRMDFQGEPHSAIASSIGLKRSANCWKPQSIILGWTGGNE